MVVGQDVAEAQTLGRLSVISKGQWIMAKLGLRENNANFHGLPLDAAR
jgi:hypothetical protein